jgi:predicted permease
MNNLKFAFRQLFKSPGFTAVAVLSLALGIGANTTVFCWIQAVVLRPLPGVSRADRLVVVTPTFANTTWGETMSLPDLRDYARSTNVFAGIIGSQITPACLSVNGQPEWVYGQIATANFFDVLGVKPLLGRAFFPDEDQKPGGHPVMVLSEGFWRRRFAGDPSIVGKVVELNRHSFTIVGVAPASFHGTMSGLNFDFWAPVAMHQQVANFGSMTNRGDHWLHTQARLQPGVSRKQAQAAASVLARQLEQSYPDTNKQVGLRLLPLWKSPYGGQALLLPVLSILLAVSLGVLAIVTANVANLLLARATTRQKEIAIRLALGAGRARLLTQLLTESVLLALIGGTLGAMLAHWGTDLLMALMPRSHLPIGYDFQLDVPTLALTTLLAVVTGITFGLIPAWQATRTDLHDTLKEGGRGSGAGASHHLLRGALVVAEVALAVLLLVSAGLCIRGFQRAHQVDLGFNPDQVLVSGLRIGMHGYTEETGKVFYRQLQERFAQVPGVKAVALQSWLPLGLEGGGSWGVQVEGYTRQPNEDTSILHSIVSPGHFNLLRIPLLDGRDFTPQDTAQTPLVAVINEAMARRFWPGQNPVGRTFSVWGGRRVMTVIGVVKTGKYRSLSEPLQSFFYTPYEQGVWDLNLGIGLRVEGDPSSYAAVLRREIHALDSGVEVWAMLTMNEFIQAAFLAQRISAILLMGSGAVALGLAALGVYGLMAYVVGQRTHEVGVRMALGAQPRDVSRLVLGQGLRLVAIGVAVGAVGAAASGRLLTTFLYGVHPFDPVTFLCVAAALSLAGLVACWLPARRAARVDPMEALRCE